MPLKIPVLLYHRIVEKNDSAFDKYCVSVDKFESQMKWLYKNGYNTIPLDEHPCIGKTNQSDTGKNVIITFDDGTYDTYQYAFPILKKYHFNAVIFLIGDKISSGAGNGETGYLSIREISEMRENGFDFQSHGQSHCVLTEVDLEQARNEIQNSRIALHQISNRIQYFAYPLGRCNPDIKSLVSQAGYKAAFGGLPQLDGSMPDLFFIGRTEIFEKDSMLNFIFKINTGFGIKLYFRKMFGLFRVKAKTFITGG